MKSIKNDMDSQAMFGPQKILRKTNSDENAMEKKIVVIKGKLKAKN